MTPSGVAGDSERLRTEGPVIECQVLPDTRRVRKSRPGETHEPPSTEGRFLLDTGATMSVVDESVLRELGIPPFADTAVCGATGSAVQKVFTCELRFPRSPLPAVDTVFVIGAKLREQGIIGLLGRDVLERGVLHYNGTSGAWTLAF